MRRLLVIFLLAALPLAAAPRRRAFYPPALYPPCTVVTGSPAVTFTRDEGAMLAPLAERLHGIGYTYGVATLDTPGTMLSFHKLTLSISTDDGCSWRPIASVPSVDFPPSIAGAPGGTAYVWSDNRQYIARYDGRGLQSLKAPGQIIGIGVDSKNAAHVRVATSDGVIWDSGNAGAAFDPIGRVPMTSLPLLYRVAFDPRDLDHLVSGSATIGASMSRDGGRTWKATNVSNGFNAFSLAFSPVDSNVVWMMALEESRFQEPPAYGRHIFRSTDGGQTFRSVVDQSEAVTLINGPLLAPSPTDPAVLYFVFGTYFAGYGTDLFRYDATTGRLTVAHNDYDGINAIAFSRTDPSVMYLGLETEEGR